MQERNLIWAPLHHKRDELKAGRERERQLENKQGEGGRECRSILFACDIKSDCV